MSRRKDGDTEQQSKHTGQDKEHIRRNFETGLFDLLFEGLFFLFFFLLFFEVFQRLLHLLAALRCHIRAVLFLSRLSDLLTLNNRLHAPIHP